MNAPALHRFARLTSAAAFILLFAGGLVTSTGAGLSVPDWPLSFGTLFPPMVGGVRFEHSHRLIAGTVAILTFVLAAWIHLKEQRLWVKRLAYAAAGAILLQALLGGLTVLLKLPATVSVAHACLAQAVFCLILALTQATSPWFVGLGSVPNSSLPQVWKAGAAACAAVYVQLILGAFLRHTGLGLPWHMLWAVSVCLALAYLLYRVFKNASDVAALRRPAVLIALLVPLQVALGFTALAILRSPTFEIGFYAAAALKTAHVATGALLLGTSFILTLRAYRLA